MSRFAHAGGAVLDNLREVPLAEACGLVEGWRRAAAEAGAALARLYLTDAAALDAAVKAAARWRRAAGWREAADHARP